MDATTAARRQHDLPAERWKRIGMMTPSSNSVLEPYTAAMLAPFGEAVSAHFARFRVTEISLSEASRTQFDLEPILTAARALADAKVDVIAWNGTSAGWLGFERDERLCAAITGETGIPATTAILSLNEALRLIGARTIGLVTPYLTEVQERIIANYAGIGVEVIADRRLEDPGNFSFAEYSPAFVAGLVREVAASGPDAIAIVCTNFRGAPMAADLEAELGVTILDSVAITVWSTVRMAGLDPARITGWGRLFRSVPPAPRKEPEGAFR